MLELLAIGSPLDRRRLRVQSPPYLFKRELMSFVSDRLGVPVAPNGLPAEVENGDPMLTVAIVDGDSLPLLASAGRSRWTSVQFDAWGTDSDQVEGLAERLVLLLNCYRGPLGRGFIQSGVAHRQLDSYEHEGDTAKSGGGPYRSLREFRFVWTAPR